MKSFLDNYERIVEVALADVPDRRSGWGDHDRRRDQDADLRGRGLAMTGSVLSMIPCLSGCCIVGLPVGIWALVVLNNPDVRAGFAATAAVDSGRGRFDDERG